MSTIDPGITSDVYRNLLRKCVSVRQHGKVVGYGQHVLVRNVTFRVQAAGVQRIRRQGQREVVAYARGQIEYLDDNVPVELPAGAQRVCFNPFVHDTFVLADGTYVHAVYCRDLTRPDLCPDCLKVWHTADEESLP